ncbi:MAG: extracellular solute-binding protein [Lachnospiraceae bacterium]|nr:extracellular solute-binding protein [Lachnospiraceae bacterium]
MKRSSGLLIWVLIAALCIGALTFAGAKGLMPSHADTVSDNKASHIVLKENVKLWYTDSDLTNLLESAAVKYNSESGRQERIVPVLSEESDFVKAVYDASVEGKDFPDVFVLSNDSFEKAYLSGLAWEIPVEETDSFMARYPSSAVNAVTYRDRILGYPWYYETAAFMYNRTFLMDWAEDRILMESTSETEEESGTAEELNEATEVSEGEAETYLRQNLPSSIEELLYFSNIYNAPDSLDAVFKWDVNDIFYTYFFAGASLNVGGETGDDPSVMDIYNENAIRSLNRFQRLNQFFSFDSRDVSYDQILEDFISGKILFTVCTTDAVKAITDAKKAGTCEYDFGSSALPDITAEIKARPLSVTNALVINGYSEKTENAKNVIEYLTGLSADDMYRDSGKASASISATFSDSAMDGFRTSYVASVPVTKIAQTGNFRLRMEAAMMRIWDGEDPNSVLMELSTDMNRQTGASFEEPERLEVEEETIGIGESD